MGHYAYISKKRNSVLLWHIFSLILNLYHTKSKESNSKQQCVLPRVMKSYEGKAFQFSWEKGIFQSHQHHAVHTESSLGLVTKTFS